MALTVGIVGGVASRTAEAQSSPPARFAGDISLFGAKPSGSGVNVKAYVGSTECGTGKISGDGYSINVASTAQKTGCGTAGAQVKFTIGSYWAYEVGTWEMGMPQEVNLSGPTTTSFNLAGDCNNEVSLTFANKTPMKTVLESITPRDVVDSVWYWNGKDWLGYFIDSSAGPSTLKTVDLNKSYWFCSWEPATLAMPVLSPSVSTSAPVPDMTVLGLTANPSTVAGATAAGQQIRYDASIRNQGVGNATGVKIVMYLPSSLPAGSTVATPTLAGFICNRIGTAPSAVTVTCENGSLASNASVTMSVTITLGGATSAGSYVTQVVVDPENTIPESDSSNNTRNVTVTVN